jgi:hypothetical protein
MIWGFLVVAVFFAGAASFASVMAARVSIATRHQLEAASARGLAQAAVWAAEERDYQFAKVDEKMGAEAKMTFAQDRWRELAKPYGLPDPGVAVLTALIESVLSQVRDTQDALTFPMNEWAEDPGTDLDYIKKVDDEEVA